MTTPPNTIPWPPILYVLAAGGGWAMNKVVAFNLPDHSLLRGAGLAAIAVALGIDVWAAVTFRAHQTTILPHRAAQRLITSGPFALSRNPIYVGNTLLVEGLGLFLGNGWLVPAAIAAAFAVQKLAIEREERHLADLFGAAWVAYAGQVRRWV